MEVPTECTCYHSLERLLLYHNTIKNIPDNIISLNSLMYLDIRSVPVSSKPADKHMGRKIRRSFSRIFPSSHKTDKRTEISPQCHLTPPCRSQISAWSALGLTCSWCSNINLHFLKSQTSLPARYSYFSISVV